MLKKHNIKTIKDLKNKLEEEMKLNKALTWDDLADLYNKMHKGSAHPARTLKMETVFNWGKTCNLLEYDEKEGTLHYKDGGKTWEPVGVKE